MSEPIDISRRGPSLRGVTDSRDVTAVVPSAEDPRSGKATARKGSFDAVLDQARGRAPAASPADRREVAVGETADLPGQAQPATVGQSPSRGTPAPRRHPIFGFVENRLQSSGRNGKQALRADEFARLARAMGPEPAKPAAFVPADTQSAELRDEIKTAQTQFEEPERPRDDSDDVVSRPFEAGSANDGDGRRDDRDRRPESARTPKTPRPASDWTRTRLDATPFRSDIALGKDAGEPFGDTAIDFASQAADEPAKETTDEPAKEPAREATRKAAKETTDEPTKETTREPVKEPAREATRKAAKEPAKEPAQEPAKEPDQEPDAEPAGAGDVSEVARPSTPQSMPAPSVLPLFAPPNIIEVVSPRPVLADWLSPKAKAAEADQVAPAVEPDRQPVIAETDTAPIPVDIEIASAGTIRVEQVPAVVQAVRTEPGLVSEVMPSGRPLVTILPEGQAPASPGTTIVLRTLAFDIAFVMPTSAVTPPVQVSGQLNGPMLSTPIPGQALPSVLMPELGAAQLPHPPNDALPLGMPSSVLVPELGAAQLPHQPNDALPLGMPSSVLMPELGAAQLPRQPNDALPLGMPSSVLMPELGAAQLPHQPNDALLEGMPSSVLMPELGTGQPPGMLIEAFSDRVPLSRHAMVLSGDVQAEPSTDAPTVLAPQAAYEDVAALVNTRPVEAKPVSPQVPALPSGQQAASQTPVELPPSAQAVSPTNTGSIALIQRMMPFQQNIIPMRIYYDAQSALRWWLWYRNYTNVLPKVSVTKAGVLLSGTETEFERR